MQYRRLTIRQDIGSASDADDYSDEYEDDEDDEEEVETDAVFEYCFVSVLLQMSLGVMESIES